MRLAIGGALLLNIGIVAGCEAVLELGGTCPGYDHYHVDPISGLRDPCHERDRDAGTDAGEDAPADAGNGGCPDEYECVPQGVSGVDWSSVPYLMWIGPKGQAPAECPERASQEAYGGYGNLIGPDAACDSCTCEASTGSCQIPTGLTAYSAPGCPPGAIATSFDAPDNWDGSCNAELSIDAGAMCGVPELPCVQSLSIDPLLIKQEACGVGTVPMPTPVDFELEALGCALGPKGVCDNGSYVCVAASDPFPGGFRHCVYAIHGEATAGCPAEYPHGPVAFYEHENLIDGRECACTCGTPVGSKCTAFVSIYEDNACTAPVFTDHMISSMASAPCIDVVPGVALQSKEITSAPYEAGTCAPKGELVGELELGRPFTVCCAPEKVIP